MRIASTLAVATEGDGLHHRCIALEPLRRVDVLSSFVLQTPLVPGAAQPALELLANLCHHPLHHRLKPLPIQRMPARHAQLGDVAAAGPGDHRVGVARVLVLAA